VQRIKPPLTEMIGATVVIRMMCYSNRLFPPCEKSEAGALWLVDEVITRVDEACTRGFGTLAMVRRSARTTRGLLRLRVAERRGRNASARNGIADENSSMAAVKNRLMCLSMACDRSDLMTTLPLALDGWLMCTGTSMQGSCISARVMLTTEGGMEAILV
jgi:hypothetical protein